MTPISKIFDELDRRQAIARLAGVAAAVGLAAAGPLRPGAALAIAPGDSTLAGPLGDVWIGSPQAKVTIIEYAAVTCPHCAAFHAETWPAIKARWVDTGHVRFALRGFLLSPLDSAGFMLARSESKLYYPILDLLFDKQAIWAFVPKPLEALRDLMRQAGFSKDKFDATLRNQSLYDAVYVVFAQARDVLGVHGTPTLFVDDTRFDGAPSIAVLDAAIQHGLDARAG